MFKFRHIALLAIMLPFAPAAAAPVEWTVASGGNGHFYDFVRGNLTFSAARSAALASSFNGQQGYLATIGSAGENAFVLALGNGSANWLGGTDEVDEGVWRWSDGPEAGAIFFGAGAPVGAFSAWNSGEPNNSGGEDYLHLQGNGTWNDVSTNATTGYFVEFSGAPAVPEPGTWALMILGFGAAGSAARLRRRPRLAIA